jgi:cytochrome c oxidase cbb3-type subunit 4
METYTAMRHFADSWGLVFMFVVFVGVVLFMFRPGGKKAAERAAQIPFEGGLRHVRKTH